MRPHPESGARLHGRPVRNKRSRRPSLLAEFFRERVVERFRRLLTGFGSMRFPGFPFCFRAFASAGSAGGCLSADGDFFMESEIRLLSRSTASTVTSTC